MRSSITHLARAKSSGGYLFLPVRLARGTFLKWLRRTHAWLGLWGAAMGFLFGISGILLNHHAVMKIPAAKTEQTEIQLSLPGPLPADANALAAILTEMLQTDFSHARVMAEPARSLTWNGVNVEQPARWQLSVRGLRHSVQAEYWQGNAFVTVKQGEANGFAMLSNLHKGVGMGVGWVLLADTLAGAIVLLSLSGTLLWTRLHGTRLVAAGLGMGSLSLAVWFAWQAF